MSALPPEETFDDYINEQLINCINLQTNVIQNLAQYSQYISLQLIDIKNHVNTLTHRIFTLQEQQNVVQYHPPPVNPMLFLQPAYHISPKPTPLSFSTSPHEQPSRDAPFIFGPITPTKHSDQFDNDDDEDENNDASYDAIVQLAPVETKTGEEDEEVLFCERAKLYRFDPSTNQMKERGTGEMKILQHHTDRSSRILMRREHVWKICANHKLTPQMDLKSHQGTANAFVWSAMDFADGETKHETLCVRFKTDEQAKQFERIFNQSKENQSTSLPSVEKISLNDDDVILIGEAKPTVRQIERARKLQLPLTFYLYENKEPCKGCRGCRDERSSSSFANAALASLLSMVPKGSSPRVDRLSSSTQLTSPPRDSRTIIKAKRSLPANRPPPPPTVSTSEPPPTEESTNAQQKKSRNVSGHQPPTRSLDDYSAEVVQNILDQAKHELQIVTTDEDNCKPSISMTKAFPFANFDATTKPPTDFHFTKEKTVTFGSSPKSGANEELEEEDVLFSEHAQLYSPADQTNELGQGAIKILRNRTTHSSRILMGEDQPSNICINQPITSELQFKPDESKENAYTWSAMDQTFAVKFPTREIAERFLQELNDAKN